MSHQDVNSRTPSSSNAPDFSNFPRGAIGRSGLPLGRNTRLLSIQAKKDLTLGGAPKKVFVPNIPVRREKSEKLAAVSEKGKKTSISIRGFHSQGQGRDKNKHRPELIQTQGGVFSEGAAESKKKNSYSVYNSHREKTESAVKIELTSIKKEVYSENCENSEILDDLMRDDFIDDGDDKAVGVPPVTLPLYAKLDSCDSKDGVVNNNVGKTIMKSEPTECNGNDPVSEGVASRVKPITAYEILMNEKEEGEGKLLLFQFPDAIPFAPVQETSTSSTERSRQTPNNSCDQSSDPVGTSLDQPEEGFLGKLQVMKSGKVRLVLGDTILDVEAGTQPGFLQDLMSIEINGNNGDMALLGHVPHKLICMPSIDDLLVHCSL